MLNGREHMIQAVVVLRVAPGGSHGKGGVLDGPGRTVGQQQPAASSAERPMDLAYGRLPVLGATAAA